MRMRLLGVLVQLPEMHPVQLRALPALVARRQATRLPHQFEGMPARLHASAPADQGEHFSMFRNPVLFVDDLRAFLEH